MTDAEIIAIRKATRTADVTSPFADSIAFARAVIAAESESPAPAQEAWTAEELAAADAEAMRRYAAINAASATPLTQGVVGDSSQSPPGSAGSRNAESHASDCALYNAPAYPAGKCDCTVSDSEKDNEGRPVRVQEASAENVAERLPDKGRAAANGAASCDRSRPDNPAPSPADREKDDLVRRLRDYVLRELVYGLIRYKVCAIGTQQDQSGDWVKYDDAKVKFGCAFNAAADTIEQQAKRLAAVANLEQAYDERVHLLHVAEERLADAEGQLALAMAIVEREGNRNDALNAAEAALAQAEERLAEARRREVAQVAECADLRERLAEVERDAARLDWLDRDDVELKPITDRGRPFVQILSVKNGTLIARANDIRAAIDVARGAK